MIFFKVGPSPWEKALWKISLLRSGKVRFLEF